MKRVTLSVIITAHHEGLIAHKTMLSIFEALKMLDKNQITYEIIIHIDNGDDATVQYFSQYSNDKRFSIFQNHFGDAGLSRNYAAERAKGKYLTFLDADDLISSNWYHEGVKMLKTTTEDLIIHPEANLTFGLEVTNPVLWLQEKSADFNTDALTLVAFNRWTSVAMGKKTIFIRYPYIESKDGYGHEDYYFNISTIADGIKHGIAKGTVQFYRRQANSVFSNNEKNKVTQPYSELFNVETIQKIPKTWSEQPPKVRWSRVKRTYINMRNIKALNAMITPMANLAKMVLGIKSLNLTTQKIPDFVIAEWRWINKIECQLYPEANILKKTVTYNSEADQSVGHAFYDLVQGARKADYIFIVPWIVSGGADKVLQNYVQAIKEIHQDWHIEIITTIAHKNVCGPLAGAHVIDFGSLTDHISPYFQDILFTRLITQLQGGNLHIINSEFGYRWAMAHQDLVKRHYKLNVSLFSYVDTPGKGLFSYADPYLLEIYPVVNRIFTDNQHIIDQAIALNGFSQDKFSVHYQPNECTNDSTLQSPRAYPSVRPFRILWASRVDISKCPEVLCEIARNLDPAEYQIDVYGRMDAHYNKSIFAGIPSLTYHGGYQGFNSIDTSPYQLFLYTSNGDGMPNILLEVTAKGLPIISSDIGGINEFIKDKKTGILIKDYNSVQEYLDAIHFAKDHPAELDTYTKNAQNLLKSQHSWQSFIEKVEKDII